MAIAVGMTKDGSELPANLGSWDGERQCVVRQLGSDGDGESSLCARVPDLGVSSSSVTVGISSLAGV